MDKKEQTKSAPFTYAVGRRLESVARVRVYKPTGASVKAFDGEYKAGDIVVNGKQAAEYFRFKPLEPVYKRIFELTGTLGKFVVTAKVEGGGIKGQMDAMIHGIARALDKIDSEAYHDILKKHGYLTRDARTRERRMVGTGGKARRQKQSPKR